jgi:hypothetical protein
MSAQPTEAAREAALMWLRSFFTIDEALIDQGHKDSLAEAFNAHAAAAVKAERERIIAMLLGHVPKSKWLMEARLREGLEFAASLIALEPIVSEAISNPPQTNHQPSEAT